MFVSESTLTFMGIKLQVMSAEGHLWEGQIDPSLTVETMKRSIFAHFYPEEISLGPDNYRVIFPKESRTLSDTHAIQEEHLEENDVLFFIRRRSANAPESDKELDLKTPTAADIYAATKDLPAPPPPMLTWVQKQLASGSGAGARNTHFAEESSGVEASVDFQLELRKIIISLVSVMATLLHGNPDADLICQQIHSRMKRRLLASNKPVEGTTFQYPPPPEVLCTPLGIVAGLAEIRKREFRPNLKAVDALKEMGFKEEQIIEALRATKNMKDTAAEFLAAGKTPNDIEAGLDPQSHLFTALVSAPDIRLGLSNPKLLLGFLTILENASAANLFLNDPDTGLVLSTIFKIYHAEKHAAQESS